VASDSFWGEGLTSVLEGLKTPKPMPGYVAVKVVGVFTG